MQIDSLISGLRDIVNLRVPTECIFDMVPEIIESFDLLVSQQKQASFSGLDYVFIAGKVNGIRRHQAVELFKDAEQYLHGIGLKSINPFSITPHVCTWSYAMRISISYMVNHCNKIYLLNNWEDSKGARLQKSLADTLGFSVIQFSGS